MEELPITCSSCQSTHFICFGLVGYRQRYDGTPCNFPAERWAAMEPDWEIDYPVMVECQNCSADVTQEFLKAGILDSLFTDPKRKALTREAT